MNSDSQVTVNPILCEGSHPYSKTTYFLAGDKIKFPGQNPLGVRFRYLHIGFRVRTSSTTRGELARGIPARMAVAHALPLTRRPLDSRGAPRVR